MKYYTDKQFVKLLAVFIDIANEELEKRKNYEFERSEKWLDSENGQQFIEKTENLEELIEALSYFET